MPRASSAEVEESYDRVFGLPDAEDEALFDHVMWPDGKPQQGLHARRQEEDVWYGEYLYGDGLYDC